MDNLSVVEQAVAQAVDFEDPYSCVVAVKQLFGQEYLKQASNNRKQRIAAQVLGRSVGWVQRYAAFGGAIPEVLHLLKERVFTSVDAEVLAELSSERQLEIAVVVSELTTREDVRDYLRREVYTGSLKKKEAAPRAPARRIDETKHKSRLRTEQRLEAKNDCRLAINTAFDVLEPLFDLPLSHIITAFAGAPKSREEFLHQAHEVQQMLATITTELKREYGIS